MRAQELLEKLTAGGLKQIHSESFHTLGTITHLQDLRTRLETLAGIPGFEADEQYFAGLPVLNSARNNITLNNAEWNAFSQRLLSYSTRLAGLEEYMAAKVNEQKPNEIFVKLPPVNTLREAVEFQAQLAKLLEQLAYLEGMDGKVELRSWEPGSLWLEIDLGNTQVLSLVGSAFWAAAVIYKKFQEGKVFAEYARGLTIKNDHMEILAHAQDELIKKLLDGESKALADSYLNGGTPEQLERIRMAIREFAEMIQRGAEVHPALKAAPEEKQRFPNFANLSLLESKTKLIENGSTEKG